MKILSMDTSSDVLSVAVFDGARKLAVYESNGPVRHSEILAVSLRKILQKAKLDIKQIDCVAVGIGPGSFAGLRVGVTTAKMLSYGLKTKLVGVSSLEARARSREDEGTFAVIVDAKKAQVYAAIYQKKGNRWKTIKKPRLVLREIFLRSLKPGIRLVDSAFPGARAVAEAALDRIAAKKFDDPFTFEPVYIHPKDCNVSRK